MSSPHWCLQIHEQRSRGIGAVCDVDAAVNASGRFPQDPGVGVAEDEVAGFRPGPYASTLCRGERSELAANIIDELRWRQREVGKYMPFVLSQRLESAQL